MRLDDPSLLLPAPDRQYRPLVIRYQPDQPPAVIEFHAAEPQDALMKQHLLTAAAAAALLALSTPAEAAECYADYKAKQDDPLRLHYGVIQLSGACQKQAARSEIQARIASDGWKLLNVLTVFGPEGLQERKANAGPYYLRF